MLVGPWSLVHQRMWWMRQESNADGAAGVGAAAVHGSECSALLAVDGAFAASGVEDFAVAAEYDRQDLGVRTLSYCFLTGSGHRRRFRRRRGLCVPTSWCCGR